MADMTYPNYQEAEIASWLQIKIHEVTSTNTHPDSDDFGKLLHDIRLLSPQAVIENNTANYTSTDFKLSSALASFEDGGAGWLESLKAGGMMAAKEAFGGLGTEMERMMGQIVNPRSEQFYTGPGFRQFTFHWELSPLTSGDASELQKIYQTIRKSTYPTEIQSTAGMLYGMPNEFKLSFVAGDDFAGSQSDPKFGRCVCTNISLNYTGAGINAVASSDGASPFLNLDMTFAERQLLHQESDPIA